MRALNMLLKEAVSKFEQNRQNRQSKFEQNRQSKLENNISDGTEKYNRTKASRDRVAKNYKNLFENNQQLKEEKGLLSDAAQSYKNEVEAHKGNIANLEKDIGSLKSKNKWAMGLGALGTLGAGIGGYALGHGNNQTTGS